MVVRKGNNAFQVALPSEIVDVDREAKLRLPNGVVWFV